MSENTLVYKCPNCDAGLSFDAAKNLFTCEFCLSEFTKGELDRVRGELNAKEAAELRENQDFCDDMNAYHCPTCGADVVSDENTAASFCPYCRNPVILMGRLGGDIKPDIVIPFAFDKNAALERFIKKNKRRWFLPKDFLSASDLDKVTGVYYPFWITDADTDGTLTGEGRKVRTWKSGNVQYTETSHYAITRRGDIHFEDITTCALSDADKKMLEGVLPYPSESFKDFSMPYLSGYLAKKRDLAKETLYGEVKGRMNGYADTLLRQTVSGYNSTSFNAPRVKVTNSDWQYALMPVWIFSYERNGKRYNYAMNGVTSKIYGALPVNGKKLALVSSIVGAVITGLGPLLYWLSTLGG